jgi:hypothetical protein
VSRPGDIRKLLVPSFAILLFLLATRGSAGVVDDPSASPFVSQPLTSSASSCTPGSGRLCVNNRRFKITASWKTSNGKSGQGNAVTLTDDTGYFWFFGESNVEVVVKVLKACSLNNRFWVFAAGLTNVQVDLTVQDMVTGKVKTYRNPLNRDFAPVQDTAAFACSGGSSVLAGETDTPGPQPALASPLTLNQGRFQVSANWQTSQGTSGSGEPVRLTDETGYFWFFQPSNIELIVKVLDACSISGKYWVFSAGLTNVKVDITVKDLSTGAVKVYSNPQSTAFEPILDTSAFSCSGGSGLPPDPGEAGKQTLAGIDSDGDGVRDDLQRYIFFNYQNSPATLQALTRTVEEVQAAILDSGSRDLSLGHATDLVRAAECVQAVRAADSVPVERALLAEALNTEQRLLAYLRYNDQLAGATFPIKPVSQWATSCTSSLAGMEAMASSCPLAEGTVVFFGNGVWNTCSDANQSAMVLASAARDVLSSDEYAKTSFQMTCNPTRGHIADVWRATKQRFSSDSAAFLRALGGINLMPDFLRDALVDKADEIGASAAVDDPTLQQHVDIYNREILEGKKVVVVAHSQGNFYANLAYQNLPAEYRPSFGIVSVANPDSYVAGEGPYTTLFGDLIIGAIPLAKRANTANSLLPDFKDLSGHMFLASYMPAGSNSRKQILRDLKQQIETLEPPPNPAGNGVITVTLNWGEEPDVDLHVFEPDGNHVYYSNPDGHVGFLDVDDVTSFGPEHYFVSCDTLAPGTYRIGLNYYSGSRPEVARIQVQAGLEVRSFQTTLPFSRGSGGNSSPIPVADIVVTGNSTTGYTFAIVPRQ